MNIETITNIARRLNPETFIGIDYQPEQTQGIKLVAWFKSDEGLRAYKRQLIRGENKVGIDLTSRLSDKPETFNVIEWHNPSNSLGENLTAEQVMELGYNNVMFERGKQRAWVTNCCAFKCH